MEWIDIQQNISYRRKFICTENGKVVGNCKSGFKQQDEIGEEYFDMETLERKKEEMFVEGYKTGLVKDTSYKGLWKVSFTLREF